MKMKTFDKKTIPIIATSVALFDFVMLYAMRSFWSGLHSAVNWAPFPYLLFGLVCAVVATSVVLLFVKPNKLYFYISGGFSLLVMCLCIYMFFQIKDMWSTIALEILYALIFCVTVGVIVFFIFFYPKTKLKDSRLFKFLLVGILVAVFVLSLVSPLFYFTNGASVYAVN